MVISFKHEYRTVTEVGFVPNQLHVRVYGSSEKADDGECDWFIYLYWVTDPSNGKILEEFDSAVEDAHSAAAFCIYKCQDVYTPQCHVAYIG